MEPRTSLALTVTFGLLATVGIFYTSLYGSRPEDISTAVKQSSAVNGPTNISPHSASVNSVPRHSETRVLITFAALTLLCILTVVGYVIYQACNKKPAITGDYLDYAPQAVPAEGETASKPAVLAAPIVSAVVIAIVLCIILISCYVFQTKSSREASFRPDTPKAEALVDSSCGQGGQSPLDLEVEHHSSELDEEDKRHYVTVRRMNGEQVVVEVPAERSPLLYEINYDSEE